MATRKLYNDSGEVVEKTKTNSFKNNEEKEKTFYAALYDNSGRRPALYEVAQDFLKEFRVIRDSKCRYLACLRRKPTDEKKSKNELVGREQYGNKNISWDEFNRWMNKKYGRVVIEQSNYQAFLDWTAGFYGEAENSGDREIETEVAKVISRCIRKDYYIVAGQRFGVIKKVYNRHNKHHEAIEPHVDFDGYNHTERICNWIGRWLMDNCFLEPITDDVYYVFENIGTSNKMIQAIIDDLYANADASVETEYIITEQENEK